MGGIRLGRWVSIGPTQIDDRALGGVGAIGRIHSIAIHPTTPTTMYVGGPNCGIWKTTNGGAAWAPVGDSLPTLALAALAVDAVTPTRVYAVLAGVGIYRSDDAAETWTQIAADLGTPAGAGVLLIDPTSPSHVYLTAGPNGLFHSTDSGLNWSRVKTGFVDDLAMHPSSPGTLYAGVRGDGIYQTITGGAAGDSAWKKLPGLPATDFTRVTIALCTAAPTTLYAGLSGNPFRVYRSTDGLTFALRYSAASSIYNPWMGVDPANPSIVYLLSANFQRSTDGGATFVVTSSDTHECQKFAADPVTPGVIYVGRDNGLFRSDDRGVTFSQIGGGIANVEFYDGALAATDPKLMIGGTQDNGNLDDDGGQRHHRQPANQPTGANARCRSAGARHPLRRYRPGRLPRRIRRCRGYLELVQLRRRSPAGERQRSRSTSDQRYHAGCHLRSRRVRGIY